MDSMQYSTGLSKRNRDEQVYKSERFESLKPFQMLGQKYTQITNREVQ